MRYNELLSLSRGDKQMRHAVLVGGSGLVGSEVAKLLAERSNIQLVALVRRPGAVVDKLPEALRSRVREVEFAFDDASAYDRIGGDLACDMLFCCIGTTMKEAGSKAGFLAVDRDIPRALIARAKTLANRPIIALVSSVGAAHPLGFYLSTKATVERLLLASGLPHVIVRPSLLLGKRERLRLVEALAGQLLPPIFRALQVLGVDRYAPIAAAKPVTASHLARVLVHRTLAMAESPERNATSIVLEGDQLTTLGALKGSCNV